MVLRLQAPTPVEPLPEATFDHVVLDSVLIGALVGLSLLLAVVLQLDRPYWVPVSCMAVLQGTTLRAVWNRNLQRVVGTAIGMLVAWGLLSLPLGPWAVGRGADPDAAVVYGGVADRAPSRIGDDIHHSADDPAG